MERFKIMLYFNLISIPRSCDHYWDRRWTNPAPRIAARDSGVYGRKRNAVFRGSGKFSDLASADGTEVIRFLKQEIVIRIGIQTFKKICFEIIWVIVIIS